MRQARLGRRISGWMALPLSVAAIVAWLIMSESARAQSSQASLQGRVINQASGEAIATALVIERNLLTNTQAYRYTNEQGYFSFPALAPGTYTVRADAMGFQAEERSPVELPVAARVELNFSLIRSEPGVPAPTQAPANKNANPRNILAIMYGADAAVPQAVLVRLPVSQVETLVGTVSSLIDENKILELPLSGRDVYTLLVLQPNVSSDNATARGLGFSVNGQQASASNFLLDGVDNNDLQVTGPATKVSADAVKEYRMSTDNYTAEYGRNSGFIANVITRSGSNEWHGSAYEYFNHDLLNANSFANNWQGLKKEPLRNNLLGGTLGGPVKRDRLFFFGSFERLYSDTRSQPSTYFFPGPFLLALAPANSIAKKLLSEFPPPDGTSVSGGLFTQASFAFPLNQENNLGLARGDYTSADGRKRISVRYSFSQNAQDDFDVSPYPGLNSPLVVRGQNFSANQTRELYGGTNELKFGFNRNSVSVIRPHPEIPTLSSQDGVLLPGSPAPYDYAFRDTVFHALDNYSRLIRGHALVMGIEWRPDLHDSLLSANRDGRYGFPSVFDFLSDSPDIFQITLNRQTGLPAMNSDFRRYYFQNEGAAFIQDNWKVMPRLNLNLGLRWEYFGAPSPRQGTVDYNYVLGSGSTLADRVASGSMQTGQLYHPDRNNFAPRFGFAYDLTGNGRTVVRGGVGIFYDRIFNNFWMDSRANNLQSGEFVNLFQQSFQYALPVRNAISGPVNQLPTLDFAIDRNLRTPYIYAWFAGVQQQLTPNLVLEINQSGSSGYDLASSDIVNRQFSVPADLATNSSGRLNPNAPDISFRSNQGKSDHLAFQVALNRRWSSGTQFQVSYTAARSRDVQSDPIGRKVGSQSDRLNRLASDPLFDEGASFTKQFDPQADYGYSDFDQRQNLVFNFTAQVPPGIGMPRLFTGWLASAIAGFRSGFPFSVVTAQPSIADPRDPSPSNYVVGGLILLNRADFAGKNASDAALTSPVAIPGGEIVLNSSQFASPVYNRLGNSARNEFRGPGFWNVDFSMSRSFAIPKMGERTSMQFRAEFFNVFNHTNLNSPIANLQDSSFGQASFGRSGVGSSSPSAAPLGDEPRHIQFALKLYF